VSALADDLESAARFGAHDGGVTRLAWTPELLEAYAWLAARARELGLEADVDGAGNLVARWQAGEAKAAVVGSHLDTVPQGGHYDGTLGVLAGLHAIGLLRERGFEPRRPIWLVSFMDEEGARFGTALFGSRAFAGDDVAGLLEREDADGVSLREAIAVAGLDAARVTDARRIDEVETYLELHIEQGPVLERAGADIGIVTAIVGLIGYRVRLTGEANHAGTTPMELRRDALAGAARVVLALRDEARRREGMTANVGRIAVEPGASNAVPGICEFTIDVRASSAAGLAEAEAFVRETLDRVADDEALELDVHETYRLDAVELDRGLADVLEDAARAEGASTLRLPSGAGHDAMVIAPHVPTAMVFVPSRGGISHSPREFTPPEQCELGARVLARALEALAS
jgi:allantoate deiminase